MNDDARQTRSHLMGLFERLGFHPRSDLGQNFLIDLNLIEFIVREADLSPRDVVLEIGAGTGGMSTFLAQQAGAVVSVEIDPHMFELAKRATAPHANVTLINRDALKNKNHFAPEVLDLVAERMRSVPDARLKLVSNLPYSVATPVVSNLVATDLAWERMVVTIQWELAERMAARPNADQYGALSVWLQAQCRVKILRKLPPNVFWPRPQVDSAIVRLFPDAPRQKAIDDREFFHDCVRRLFAHRRKRLRSTLVGMYRMQLEKSEVDAILAEVGFPEDQRAEQMPAEDLVRLSNRMRKAVGPGDGVLTAETPDS